MKKLLLIITLLLTILNSQDLNNISDEQLKKMIGQMLIIGFEENEVNENSQIIKDINKYNIGGVILFDRFYEDRNKIKNIKSPQQLKKLNQDLQKYTNTKLIIAVDQEGGKVQRLKPSYGFTSTPSAKEISQKTLKEAKNIYDNLAIMLSQNAINCNLAPVVDLEINNQNFVIKGLNRAYSDSPKIVTSYAKTFIKSMKEKNILSVIKHFPGHGSSKDDSHKGFVDVTNTWTKKELEPYKNLISQNIVNMIMTAHIFNKNLDENYPATLSYKTNTKLLRKELNYDRVIISDDLQMKAISQYYSLKQTVTLSINSGVDILLFGNQLAKQDTKELINTIFKEVKNGNIPYFRIIESNERIKKLKGTIWKMQ